MKHTKSIIAIITTIGLVFSSTASIGMVKSTLNKGNDISSFDIVITAEDDIYGLQFDILYDTDELEFVECTNLMTQYSFNYKEKDNGVIRGLLFSLDGVAIVSANGVANMIEMEFKPVDNFSGSSFVEFSDVILAGIHGQEILTSVSGFEVNFGGNNIPTITSLSKNYPNPFNPTTQIPFSLAEPGFVSAVIYNINGAEVKTLVSGYRDAGEYMITWKGLNNDGASVASGRYILKMNAPQYTDSITMTLLK